MPSFAELLEVLVASSLTAAALGFVAKTVLERYVDHLWKAREAVLEARLGAKAGASEALFDKELTVYPELVEVVYRCRNLARSCLDEATRTRQVVSDFAQLSAHLTENLYKYRLFVPEQPFRQLHRFKTEVQEFAVLLNEVTRSTQVEDAPVDPAIRAMAHGQMRAKYALIDRLHEQILRETQALIRAKTTIELGEEPE